ncbi:hypothetical protein EDM00_09050 [Ornithobacterium rhinotracheale]|uniref:hypothetical protein n=1 Tax=Ornithobacterium rhinotracheale TaxID=28251 RepID=UPI00129C56FE|nr:hypothetical protein [Ornithobacterium rhinotracheale]MRI64134.1 hypothetical protein [Ornithobacterium rhinotracheale]
MKSNQEILDEFGKILVRNAYDFCFEILKENISFCIKNNILEENINDIIKEYSESMLFNLLKIFEEDERFRLIYEENGQQVDLVKISEMLKAEPIIENGWIDRFSKYAGEKDK